MYVKLIYWKSLLERNTCLLDSGLYENSVAMKTRKRVSEKNKDKQVLEKLALL